MLIAVEEQQVIAFNKNEDKALFLYWNNKHCTIRPEIKKKKKSVDADFMSHVNLK